MSRGVRYGVRYDYVYGVRYGVSYCSVSYQYEKWPILKPEESQWKVLASTENRKLDEYRLTQRKQIYNCTI